MEVLAVPSIAVLDDRLRLPPTQGLLPFPATPFNSRHALAGIPAPVSIGKLQYGGATGMPPRVFGRRRAPVASGSRKLPDDRQL